MEENLKKLSLSELESLYRLIDEGIFDGIKTSDLIQYYTDTSLLHTRETLLINITKEIKLRISSIIL